MEPDTTLQTIARETARDMADGAYRHVTYDVDDQRATVTINRPDVHNCFDYRTLLELADALHRAGRDPAIRVVVLTGAGERAFCTGADLKEQNELMLGNQHNYYVWMGAFVDVHERLRNIGKPTIARLNGMAVGGGNEFNMACDLAIAADHAYIRHVGPAHGSVPAGGATQWLALFVGDRRAREIIWLGENVPAAQALEWGLVNRVVPGTQLDAAVDDMVAQLLRTLPETIRYTRTQTNFWKDFAWYQTIHHARDWLALHTSAPEVHDAVSGFVSKQRPDYDAIGRRYGTGQQSHYWGAPAADACPSCGADHLPAGFSHCGNCGGALPRGVATS